MRLVFVHGWGFDASFWNALGACLADVPQTRVELGFLDGDTVLPARQDDDILVGHSLGFAWGLSHQEPWRRWVAINSFARFVDSGERKGCMPLARLRALRHGLVRDAAPTLGNFYRSIDADIPNRAPHVENLRKGLNWLADLDLSTRLSDSGARGLILAASNDPLVPVASTQLMATQAQGAALLWHDEAGHLLPLREPAWCAAAIRKYAL